jgi:hypothetical protein
MRHGADPAGRCAWAAANRAQFADPEVADTTALARVALDAAAARLAAHVPPGAIGFGAALARVAVPFAVATLIALVAWLALRRR